MTEIKSEPPVMTWEEIERKFDSEWVLIGDPDLTETLEVRSGRVLYHSTDREEISRAVEELNPGRIAILYIGDLPEDMEFLL